MTISDADNLAKALTYTKAMLSISVATYDTLLWSLIKWSVWLIQNETWIDLLNVSQVVETINGTWQRQVFLETLPVATITKVEYNANKRWTEDRQELDADNYVVQDNWTLSFAFNLYRGFQNIKITYTTGFADFDVIPRKYEQLKVAMSLIVWNIFNTRKQGWLSSESVSGTSLVFDKKSITSDVQQMLDQFAQFTI